MSVTVQNGKPDIKPRQQTGLLFWVVMLAISLAGMAALGWSTRFGLGLVNDSAAYINGADNLRLGNGYMRTSGAGELKPITHFPPLYSTLIALVTLPGQNLLQTAHAINLILFGLDIVLVGSLVYLASQSRTSSLLSALLMALSDTFLGVYAMLLSEALFITLMLLAFLSLWKFFTHPRAIWIFICGMLIGLAYLTRFAGISLWITVLILLVGVAKTAKRLLQECLFFLAGSLPFILGWNLFTFVDSDVLGNRAIIVHWVPVGKVFEALKNLLSWVALDDLQGAHPIFGWSLSAFSLLLLPVLLTWVTVWFWQVKGKSEIDRPNKNMLAVYALHNLVYFAFLLITVSFFDASTPFNNRILSILYITQLILFGSVLGYWTKPLARNSKAFRLVYPAVVLIFTLLSCLDGLREVEQLGRDGLGFNHSGLRESPTIQYIQAQNPIIFYSNRPNAIYLLTGKASYIIPTKVDPVTTQNRPSFRSDLEAMQKNILAGKALLVLFQEEGGLSSEETTLLTAGLAKIADFDEADIYSNP